ncbi:MAG: hypothetical protein INR73_18605 [Williamsia sp.]|nr:hypothetical protein [Williamsia sp.]
MKLSAAEKPLFSPANTGKTSPFKPCKKDSKSPASPLFNRTRLLHFCIGYSSMKCQKISRPAGERATSGAVDFPDQALVAMQAGGFSGWHQKQNSHPPMRLYAV